MERFFLFWHGEIMEHIWKEVDTGEIHIRDSWQLELKSDYLPLLNLKKNVHTQELFFFIPNALLISNQTYNKQNFYDDQTTLIRLKTPKFTLEELNHPYNVDSPLSKIRTMQSLEPTTDNLPLVIQEYKLLSNIMRSALRDQTADLMQEIQKFSHAKLNLSVLNEKITQFSRDLHALRLSFWEFQRIYEIKWKKTGLAEQINYVDDFISHAINNYLTELLQAIRRTKTDQMQHADQVISKILVEEKQRRLNKYQEKDDHLDSPLQEETILYKEGLLNKFVLDALLLGINRSSLDYRLRDISGGISAAVAMLLYLLLFVWQGQVFINNSEPFILFTVVIYVLKDRLKEGLRGVFYTQAYRWFSDYKTQIFSPIKKKSIGKMDETFALISSHSLQKEISEIRNSDFHEIMPDFHRPESIIYYKQLIQLFRPKLIEETNSRSQGLHIIFRLELHRILQKASDAYEEYRTINPETNEVVVKRLPKIYHLNIIMRSTYPKDDLTKQVDIRNFRVIVDKNGIKRIETLSH